MSTDHDETIVYAEAVVVIEAIAAMPDWALSIVDTCRGRGSSLTVRRRFDGHFEVAIPVPTAKWGELVETLALVAFLVDAEDALAAPGDDLASAHRITQEGIDAAARGALDLYRTSVAA